MTTTPFDAVREKILAARSGDRVAQGELAAAYVPHVQAVVRREMGDALRARHEADDLAQEVWARALRSFDTFRGDGEPAFRAWLAAMASHVARDQARRAKARGAGRDVPLDASAAAFLAASAPSPSRVIRRRERSARLGEALAALTEDHRRVIELCRIEGLAVKDVAERMGRTPNAVSMLLLRALRELKARFGRTESLSLPRPEAASEEGGGDERAR